MDKIQPYFGPIEAGDISEQIPDNEFVDVYERERDQARREFKDITKAIRTARKAFRSGDYYLAAAYLGVDVDAGLSQLSGTMPVLHRHAPRYKRLTGKQKEKE